MTLHPLAPTTGRDENGKAMIPGAADWTSGQHESLSCEGCRVMVTVLGQGCIRERTTDHGDLTGDAVGRSPGEG